MLDLRAFRSGALEARERLGRRGDPGVLEELDRALALDSRRREIIGDVEVLKARRNEVSREIGSRKREGLGSADLIADMQVVADGIRDLDGELQGVEGTLREVLLAIPNVPDDRVPAGGEGEFVVVRTWGEPAEPCAEPKAHWDLGANLQILSPRSFRRVSGIDSASL